MICDTHPGLHYYPWLPLFSSAILRRLVCLLLALSSFGSDIRVAECPIGRWLLGRQLTSKYAIAHVDERFRVELCCSYLLFLLLHTFLATPLAGKSCVHCPRAMCVASHHGTIVLYHAPVHCCGTFHTDYGCFTGGTPGQGHCAPWFLPCVSTGCISPLGLCSCFLGIALVVVLPACLGDSFGRPRWGPGSSLRALCLTPFLCCA